MVTCFTDHLNQDPEFSPSEYAAVQLELVQPRDASSDGNGAGPAGVLAEGSLRSHIPWLDAAYLGR